MVKTFPLLICFLLTLTLVLVPQFSAYGSDHTIALSSEKKEFQGVLIEWLKTLKSVKSDRHHALSEFKVIDSALSTYQKLVDRKDASIIEKIASRWHKQNIRFPHVKRQGHYLVFSPVDSKSREEYRLFFRAHVKGKRVTAFTINDEKFAVKEFFHPEKSKKLAKRLKLALAGDPSEKEISFVNIISNMIFPQAIASTSGVAYNAAEVLLSIVLMIFIILCCCVLLALILNPVGIVVFLLVCMVLLILFSFN